jgi:hypothetical protein
MDEAEARRLRDSFILCLYSRRAAGDPPRDWGFGN